MSPGDGLADAVERQIVGVMTERILDLDADLLDAEQAEGEDRHPGGRRPAHALDQREGDGQAEEDEEELDGLGVSERDRRPEDALGAAPAVDEAGEISVEELEALLGQAAGVGGAAERPRDPGHGDGNSANDAALQRTGDTARSAMVHTYGARATTR